MLLDSNIIIYAAQKQHAHLRRFIEEHSPAVSAVSYVEVLGYHKLTEADRTFLEEFFSAALLLPITMPVLDCAVRLRQGRKMTLGDSLVASTALVNNQTLVTRNVDDFANIPRLELLNPFPS